VYVNQACCELLGYSFEEFHDMHIWEIDASLNPESWPQAWARVDAAGTLPHKETVTDKDGREHEVEVSSTHIEYRGETYGISVARDVTERLRTEESLRLTQFVVDHAPDSMHWLDPEGRFTYANEAACRLLGYSLEELQGMHLWDISPHATFQEFKERWGASKEGGTILFEDVYRAKDGRQFEVEIAAANFHQQGREMGVAFVRDITEWKRAQQSLRDSEERYRQLFELESDAIVLSEEGSGAVMEVNKAACALYGYTKAELLSMRDDGLFCEAERPEPASTAFTGDLTSQWHRKKDGTVFPVEIRSRHFEWKGSQVKVTTVRDVSEHKRIADELEESRQMLRQVLDTLPLEVRWRDRDLRYLGVNLAAARASNLSDPSKAIGMTDQEMPVHNLSEQCRIDDQEVLATTASKLDYVETVDLSNGATVVKRTSKVPLRDRSGDVIGVLAIHENITEQVATRQALREREEQLRQAQKMEAVGRLAGGIAHDFNNVLTTIIGYSDLIRSSEDCPKGSIAEDVGEIRAAAERASGLTRRILAFSRRQTLQPVVLSLNAVVSETERILARTLGADIELRTSLSPDLGLVEVDEHQFVQVLLNLAVNARDAMPDGGVLTIGTANADLDQHFCETHPDVRPGPHVMLSVSDTGTGMDADTMAHAFEPFYTTKPPGEGTGLGLSTVYGVVAQSGGCTCIRSEPGQGATFTVYLPRAQTPTLTPGPASGPGASEGRGKTILVLDGDATFLGLTSRILERRGYNVLGVSNSEQAMATLSDPALNIDALITDTALPGHEQDDRVAAFASTSRPGLPVLFMSAQPRDRMVREGEMSERAACLEKPFTAEELLSRVRASLGEP
jgi:two-component system cell cycle sensor histidine kinase/response regulator CckA